METPGEWLEKALNDLCKQMQSSLSLDGELISGLVSFCELAPPEDAKEYLDNIVGQEAGKSVIEEYLRRRGFSVFSSNTPDVATSKLHAYVKPPSHEGSVSGTKKPLKTLKEATSSSNVGNRLSTDTGESRNANKGNQGASKKKKSGKVVSLAEAAKGSIVFQQGKPCLCQARRHKLVSNCLSCGKIVCEQEGEGPCSFCGALVLREGSTYAGLDESVPILSDADAVAEAYAKRLVDYDRNSAARTTVIDDQSDYYEIEGNSWLSVEEKELLRKKREEIEEAERAQRNKVVVTFDLLGRKVMVNKDEASESESNSILRPPDEREVNRIKPNPTLKVQPVFINLGAGRKPVEGKGNKHQNMHQNMRLASGLCLEITGRVQHNSNDLKGLILDNQLGTVSNGDLLPGSSVNASSHIEDDIECH